MKTGSWWLDIGVGNLVPSSLHPKHGQLYQWVCFIEHQYFPESNNIEDLVGTHEMVSYDDEGFHPLLF